MSDQLPNEHIRVSHHSLAGGYLWWLVIKGCEVELYGNAWTVDELRNTVQCVLFEGMPPFVVSEDVYYDFCSSGTNEDLEFVIVSEVEPCPRHAATTCYPRPR